MNFIDRKISLRHKRTTPRIISRSYVEKSRRTENLTKTSFLNYHSNNDTSSSITFINDVEEELQSKIRMRGGIIVPISASQKNQNIDDDVANKSNLNKNFSECSMPCNDYDQIVVLDQSIRLPGVAEDIESYPCPICGPDRVFLTANGLEKHAQEYHVFFIEDIKLAIQHIQNEWDRRRNKKYLKLYSKNSDTPSTTGKNSTILVLRKNPTILNDSKKMHLQQYEVCKLCGTMISTTFSSVMEKHIQAHKKNNELRENLLQQFGTKYVNSMTCKECSLVFSDAERLINHIKLNHLNKSRRYLCRWCGKMFNSFSDLNWHKLNFHDIPIDPTSNVAKYLKCKTVHSLSELKNNADQLSKMSNNDDLEIFNENEIASDNQLKDNIICRTKCDICGLIIIKPSLLLRHMIRVHNEGYFTAEIVSWFRPPVKFSISNKGRVIWTCCNQNFNDRNSILTHRKQIHIISNKNIVENSCNNLQQKNESINQEKILIEQNSTLTNPPSSKCEKKKEKVNNG